MYTTVKNRSRLFSKGKIICYMTFTFGLKYDLVLMDKSVNAISSAYASI